MNNVHYLAVSQGLCETAREPMAAGNLIDAVGAFRRSINASPHFKTLELLGECYARLGKFTRAIVPLAAATALNRQSRAPALLAEVFEKLGHSDQAAEMAHVALERS